MTVPEFVDDFFKDDRTGFACELGAADGLFLSNTINLERKGWDVICIEANPLYWERLAANRRFVLPIACATSTGVGDFQVWGKGDYFASHSGLKPSPECAIEGGFVGTFKVPTLPLSRCFEMFSRDPIDFLSLDVEGSELDVLQSLGDYRPRLLCVENVGHHEEVPNYLRSIGYRLFTSIEQDEIYLREP